jgi:N-methylhydantoinase A
VQLVNLRLTAIGRLPGLALAQPSRPEASRRGRRAVWFGGQAMDCGVLWREGLAPAEAIAGPAVIEALDSTTVVPPGWTARVAAQGFLRMTRS